MKPVTRRTVMAGAAAAAAVVPVIGKAATATSDDAELRKLWATYLVQLAAYDRAERAYRVPRKAMEAELGPMPWGGWPNKDFKRAWDKYGMEPLSEAWNREGRKLRRTTKAIRKARAESLFGVGVKLSVVEDPDDICEWELSRAVDDARRSIATLIGVDFTAATEKLDA